MSVSLKTEYMTIRLPKDLRSKVEQHAKRQHRSLSAQVMFWIEKAVENEND